MSLTAAASTMLRITNLRIAEMRQVRWYDNVLHLKYKVQKCEAYTRKLLSERNTFIFWAGPGAVGTANVLNMATAVLSTSVIPSFLCHP